MTDPTAFLRLDAPNSLGSTATGASFATSTGDVLEVSCYGPGVFRLRAGPNTRPDYGIVYLVSVTGVTGARSSISDGLGELINRVRAHTSAPVCVGFGIGTPEQSAQVGAQADGVIVGSACVKTIGGSQTPVETAKQFAAEFRSTLSELRK